MQDCTLLVTHNLTHSASRHHAVRRSQDCLSTSEVPILAQTTSACSNLLLVNLVTIVTTCIAGLNLGVRTCVYHMYPGGDKPAACRPSGAADAHQYEISAVLACAKGIEAFLSSHAADSCASGAHEAASGTSGTPALWGALRRTVESLGWLMTRIPIDSEAARMVAMRELIDARVRFYVRTLVQVSVCACARLRCRLHVEIAFPTGGHMLHGMTNGACVAIFTVSLAHADRQMQPLLVLIAGDPSSTESGRTAAPATEAGIPA